MKTYEDSLSLAKEMVMIGNIAGIKTYALITDMNQPLGNMVGNTLEVKEAIQTLNGQGPSDLIEVSLSLASYMLLGAGRVDSIDEGRKLLQETIDNKSALHKFAEFIKAQGGNSEAVYDTDKFKKASMVEDLISDTDGYVTNIHTDEVGMTSLTLGGGRERKDSHIDLSVGIHIHKKIGDRVEKGDAIASLHSNDKEKMKAAKERLRNAYEISDTKKKKNPYVYAVVTKDGVTKL